MKDFINDFLHSIKRYDFKFWGVYMLGVFIVYELFNKNPLVTGFLQGASAVLCIYIYIYLYIVYKTYKSFRDIENLKSVFTTENVTYDTLKNCVIIHDFQKKILINMIAINVILAVGGVTVKAVPLDFFIINTIAALLYIRTTPMWNNIEAYCRLRNVKVQLTSKKGVERIL